MPKPHPISAALRAAPGRINAGPRRALALLLLIALAFMLLWGRSKSPVALHIDEMWQHSYANSHGKHLYVLDTTQGNQWLSPTVFRDYISVQPGQRFSYAPINRAARYDVHPPLSHYALHTVSSFFPNRFTKWFGLSINITCYLLTIACLYALSRHLFATPARALFATGLWAFSLGAVNTVMYIRMYCPLTLFAVAAVWFLVRYDKRPNPRDLTLLFAAFILGGLTDYIFWILAFFLTAAFCLLRLPHRPRASFTLGAVALAAFTATCLIFPHTITQFIDKQTISSQVSTAIDPAAKLLQFFHIRPTVDRLLTYTADQALYMSPTAAWFLLRLAALLLLIFVAVISIQTAAAAAPSSANQAPIPADPADGPRTLTRHQAHLLRRSAGHFADNIRRFARLSLGYLTTPARPAFLIPAVFLAGYTLAVLFPDYHIWTVRGFFFLLPFLSIAFAHVLLAAHDHLRVGKPLLLSLLLLLAAREHYVIKSPFLQSGGYNRLSKKLRDTHVIFVLDSQESGGRLANFCASLSLARSVYVTISDSPAYRQQVINALRTAENPGKIRVINTTGGVPTNTAAIDTIGPDLLLTSDPALTTALKQQGYHLELEKKHIHVFNHFNLYELVPTDKSAPAAAPPPAPSL